MFYDFPKSHRASAIFFLSTSFHRNIAARIERCIYYTYTYISYIKSQTGKPKKKKKLRPRWANTHELLPGDVPQCSRLLQSKNPHALAAWCNRNRALRVSRAQFKSPLSLNVIGRYTIYGRVQCNSADGTIRTVQWRACGWAPSFKCDAMQEIYKHTQTLHHY